MDEFRAEAIRLSLRRMFEPRRNLDSVRAQLLHATEQRDTARKLVEQWTQAVLENYPPTWAFDPVQPAVMVANVKRYAEGAARRQLEEARAAFWQYAEHRTGCAEHGKRDGCDCGLTDLRGNAEWLTDQTPEPAPETT